MAMTTELDIAAHAKATAVAPGPPYIPLGRLFPEAAAAVGGYRADGQFVVMLLSVDELPHYQYLAMDPDWVYAALCRIRAFPGPPEAFDMPGRSVVPGRSEKAVGEAARHLLEDA